MMTSVRGDGVRLVSPCVRRAWSGIPRARATTLSSTSSGPAPACCLAVAPEPIQASAARTGVAGVEAEACRSARACPRSAALDDLCRSPTPGAAGVADRRERQHRRGPGRSRRRCSSPRPVARIAGRWPRARSRRGRPPRPGLPSSLAAISISPVAGSRRAQLLVVQGCAGQRPREDERDACRGRRCRRGSRRAVLSRATARQAGIPTLEVPRKRRSVPWQLTVPPDGGVAVDERAGRVGQPGQRSRPGPPLPRNRSARARRRPWRACLRPGPVAAKASSSSSASTRILADAEAGPELLRRGHDVEVRRHGVAASAPALIGAACPRRHTPVSAAQQPADPDGVVERRRAYSPAAPRAAACWARTSGRRRWSSSPSPRPASRSSRMAPHDREPRSRPRAVRPSLQGAVERDRAARP